MSIYTRIFRVRSRGMSCTMEAVETVKVRPRRRRNADGTYTDSVKIMLTMREMQPLVHLPVHTAALSLGISSTTLKKTCRLLGMPRWPYTRKGTSYSKSSLYPLWDPHVGTHPLCLDSATCQGTDEVPDEGCDLWFLACECSPRCGPLCEFTSRPNVDPSWWV